MEISYNKQAKIFKALCDEKRLKIIELLQGGEKCACVLIEKLDMAQSSLSYHMKILCESGIITCRKDGKWSFYAICKEGSDLAQTLLKSMTRLNPDVDDECTCKEKI